MDDFVFTIDSEDEDTLKKERMPLNPERKHDQFPVADMTTLDPAFRFEVDSDFNRLREVRKIYKHDVVNTGSKPKPILVDDIIHQHRTATEGGRKRKRDPREGNTNIILNGTLDAVIMGSSDDNLDQLKDHSRDRQDLAASITAEIYDTPQKDFSEEEESDAETQIDRDRKNAFFAPVPPSNFSSARSSFLNLNLSRPLLRAISELGFVDPTPIQASTIPVALEGHDVLGSAVTGSGKTAAFMIPILERLMFRDKSAGGDIRVLILVPTRELAVQCTDVGKSFGRFMDVSFGLVVGGLSLKAQEAVLRSRPDIVIATPGRLIDHLHNTPSFSLGALDILVLDEADRMLSDGFAAELHEVISSCPKSRQTMLFSATMTDDVDSLVRLSMNRPVRLFVDAKKTVARKLVQEFVRIRREDDRQSLLVSICGRTAIRSVIIFFRSKMLCHQMKVLFGLLGMQAAELHGNLSQEQRLDSLRQFREGRVNYLLATDLASRGLDIKGVETVINYDMPSQVELYLHRVGRTARAAEVGRSISLVGESDRRLLKAVIKKSEADKIRHRVVPPDAVGEARHQIAVLQDEVRAVLNEEKEQKLIRKGEMEATKAENMIEHRDEIYARPKRTWFQSKKEKIKAEEASKQQYEGGFRSREQLIGETTSRLQITKPKNQAKVVGASGKFKRQRGVHEEDNHAAQRAMEAAVRSAKKLQRPSRIRKGVVGPTERKIHEKQRSRQKKEHTTRFGSDVEFKKQY